MRSFASDPAYSWDVILPARYRECTLDAFQPETPSQQAALRQARRMVAGEIGSLVLIGPAGVGKSHLAAAVLRAMYEAARAKHDALPLVEKPWDVSMPPYLRGRMTKGAEPPALPEWQNVAALIVGMRSDFDRDRDEREWTGRGEELAQHPALVVLDDLGREKISDWTGETIYTLVNGRYESMLPTIVTSNLTGPELTANGYWPVISRLAEGGALVEMAGPDHRIVRKP
jgi:DNA replication protein DnaC